MIGQTKMNERLHDMTQNRVFLDVGVSATKKMIELTSNNDITR